MSEKKDQIYRRLGSILIFITFITALTGCTQNIPTDFMSDEDLQTCDASVALMNTWHQMTTGSAKAEAYLVKPGEAVIKDPLSGIILPFTNQVDITFTQPPANTGVSYRHYRVVVYSIDGKNPQYVDDQYNVTAQPPNELHVTWTPPGSGKYLVAVFIRNLETVDGLFGSTAQMSLQLEAAEHNMQTWTINYGPYSLAYACVQIDIPSGKDVKTNLQIGTVGNIQNITVELPTKSNTFTLTPTLTKTVTRTATFTDTPTLLPSFTSTHLIPSFTSTATKKPPTIEPPTDTPEPEVNCSVNTTERDCVEINACHWVTNPASGAGSCEPRP
jgi:hypothetical protein